MLTGCLHPACLMLWLLLGCVAKRERALSVWRRADAVCFDVDSTVTLDEGIDELAAFFGVGAKVAEYTNKAMNGRGALCYGSVRPLTVNAFPLIAGSVKFEDALAARLTLIQPTTSGLQAMLQAHPPRLSPGIKALVQALHAKGIHVFLVSGGFRQLIAPVRMSRGRGSAREEHK
jgi:phosphoserine phosphatase